TAVGFVLDATTGSWNVSGTLIGGTVTATGAQHLTVSNGTLDGVTVVGSLDDTGTLGVTNNLTLNGTLTTLSGTGINFHGNSSGVGTTQIVGTTTGGSATIALGGTFFSNNPSNNTIQFNAGVTLQAVGT